MCVFVRLKQCLRSLPVMAWFAMVDADMDFVPTPSVSRAIIRYNESHFDKADGIVITPSITTPDNGGY